METRDGTRAPRRRFLALMRREKSLELRASRAQADGVPLASLDRALAEIWALRWAVAELARLYPVAAERARHDLEREDERRRVRDRGGSTST